MTNQEILQTAMQQSAYDCCCEPEDFCKETNIVVTSKKNRKARKYLSLPFDCNLVSYGNNIVASTSETLSPIVEKYINSYPVEHCFETPNFHVFNDRLQEKGFRLCFMAEYFLPDINQLKKLPSKYEIRILHQTDFAGLYTPQWSNALCKKRKRLDILGAGAYDKGKLVGLAGCSADCETMYQIGIDVLPDYRREGIASALTSTLALEIISLNKVPFYCAAWSNIKSVRNALKSGFRPAWVELTAKSSQFVNRINGHI